MPIDPEFERLVKEFLTSVLTSPAANKGWKTAGDDALAAVAVRMFPDAITSIDAATTRDSI